MARRGGAGGPQPATKASLRISNITEHHKHKQMIANDGMHGLQMCTDIP